MNLVIILCALALVLGIAILFIKAAKFIAEHGEQLTKLLLVLTIVLIGLAALSYFKPELIPQLTVACNKVADCIRLIVKPYTV
jgi:hypothetical protein